MYGEKCCPGCGEVKARDRFHLDRKRRDGLQTYCKACHRQRMAKWWVAHGKESYAKHKENQREWRIKNPERYAARQRRYHLRRKYGFDQAEFQARLVSQGGKCACCGASGMELVVDHCHARDRVRELICQPCNKMLGCAEDDVTRLEKSIAYLKKHQAEAL